MPSQDPGGAENRASQLRERIIQSLPAYPAPGPRTASTVYVWPTGTCPVGCAHCNFASPIRAKDESLTRVARHPGKVIDFVNQLGSWKVVLSGGGEPMAEPDFVLDFIRGVRTDGLRELEIITSGMFGADERLANDMLGQLAQAFQSRGDSGSVRFKLRLSLDWFHADRLGVEPVANIIRAISGSDFENIFDVYIRSVLMTGDPTMQRLADLLGGSLSGIEDFQQALTLPGGGIVPVYYKNLIVDGRMSWRKLEARGLGLHPDAAADQFVQRFVDPRGKHVPARTYNGPQVEHLDGLALIVENDGGVKILEGNAPDRVPSLFSRSWDECLDYLYADPITIYLIEEGPLALAELLEAGNPGGSRLLVDTNQLYYLADKLLATAARRLLATSLILASHVGTGRLRMAPSALEAIQAEVAECLELGDGSIRRPGTKDPVSSAVPDAALTGSPATGR